MISICIPVYNSDITSLVNDLYAQALQLGLNFEIRIIDDASTNTQLAALNEKAFAEKTSIHYKKLHQNIGRAAIRNLLAKESQFEWILFLDADVKVISNFFLNTYIAYANNHKADIYSGGRMQSKQAPKRAEQKFRWLYGMKREQHSAFMSNNFFCRKAVFEKVTFDERIRTYGHEDSLFGFQAENNGFLLQNIDNPIMAEKLDDCHIFLRKSRDAIQNLWFIYNDILAKDERFLEHIRLLKYHDRIQKTGLQPLVSALFKKSKNQFERSICKATPFSLFAFDLYKLGQLCTISQ